MSAKMGYGESNNNAKNYDTNSKLAPGCWSVCVEEPRKTHPPVDAEMC